MQQKLLFYMIQLLMIQDHMLNPFIGPKQKIILQLKEIQETKMLGQDIIDGFTKVTDKDAALYTQRLAKDEGMFLGNSAGAAIKGVLQLKNEFKKEDVVVVLFHDHGSRYVGKIFNDDWMRKMGYIDK